MYLEQHVGPHHGNLVDDEQLQVGVLNVLSLSCARGLLVAFAMPSTSAECRVIPCMLKAATPTRRCREENCDVVRLHLAGGV